MLFATWVIFVHLVCYLLYQTDARISFTANGEWKETNDPNICSKRYMCTPSDITWHPNYESTVYGKESGCEMLRDKGIKEIKFYGDSYLRHAFQAVAITLREDYKQGAMGSAHKKPAECQYSQQLTLKSCVDPDPQLVCDDKITLGYYSRPDYEVPTVYNDGRCEQEAGVVYFFSEGNHPIPGQSRKSINNFWTYGDLYENLVCPATKRFWDEHDFTFQEDHSRVCSLWWVSTHFRHSAFHPEETVERVLEYNEGMRAFFDGVPGGRQDPSALSSCRGVNYVDVYNMTRALALNHAGDAPSMTYDKVHWSMEVNLVKAQILLNALASGKSKVT